MNKDIILKAPGEELTKEKIEKIHSELGEFKKETRHRVLLEQAFFISLFVVFLTIILEMIDYGLGFYNVSKFTVITIKLIFIALLLLIALSRYKSFYSLEGKPGFYITPEYLKDKSDKEDKNKIKGK